MFLMHNNDYKDDIKMLSDFKTDISDMIYNESSFIFVFNPYLINFLKHLRVVWPNGAPNIVAAIVNK